MKAVKVYKYYKILGEYSTSGTRSITIENPGYYNLEIVGAGGGGAHNAYNKYWRAGTGGSGAGFIGDIYLTSGLYAVTVGAGGYEKYDYPSHNYSQSTNGGDSLFSKINSYTRNYYKYQYSSWTRPDLSSNGVLGGNSFAVAIVGSSYNGDAYQSFDGSTSTSFRPYAGNGLIFYNPIPLNITNLACDVAYSNEGISVGTLYASNDNTNWDLISNNIGGGQTWSNSITMTGYYKYFKLMSDTVLGGRGSVAELLITATQRDSIPGTASDYDYYEDDITSKTDYIIAGGGTGGDVAASTITIGTGGILSVDSSVITRNVKLNKNGNNGNSSNHYGSYLATNGGLSVYDNTLTGYGAGGSTVTALEASPNAISGYFKLYREVESTDDYDYILEVYEMSMEPSQGNNIYWAVKY